MSKLHPPLNCDSMKAGRMYDYSGIHDYDKWLSTFRCIYCGNPSTHTLSDIDFYRVKVTIFSVCDTCYKADVDARGRDKRESNGLYKQ